ncbi:GPI mannosyltransferase 1 [Pectinophora gossypiella]|uniref:GPI alpha-1,4-mannosyltransferase I, catalytic subunit n=1 Tax=Pectinophora gossypiella TaxID=13191 RepID=A0A1E1W669_PECGO|nr:GPI mannosyltransferase 1 [Pectinophora gossypiella]
MERVKQFINLPFTYHLFFGHLLRLFLILYADYHDQHFDVPYTDVDYKVFTDAARHVLKGESPYKRHTYRYSPVIAYLLLPNIVIGRNFGKLLFSTFDVLVTIAIKSLVEHQLGGPADRQISRISMYCALFWLYNPMSIAISTRGNADTVPCFFIILSVLFLQTNVVRGMKKYALSGILLGIAIHLRLYPLVFSFPMYLSLGDYKINRRTSMSDGLLALIPNKKQITLALTCVLTLFTITHAMYLLYQYEFLFETYIYHLFRKDTRHNFSVLFYYSYLTMDQLAFDMVKTISQVLEFIILFVISLAFGEPQTLTFAMFCQAVVLVAFNSVMTSQYFVWFLSLLPLVVHNLKIKPAIALVLAVIWLATQGAWLFYAYLLEFKSREVFILIWLKSILFFCANIYVLGQLIKNYCPGYGFGQLKMVLKKTK